MNRNKKTIETETIWSKRNSINLIIISRSIEHMHFCVLAVVSTSHRSNLYRYVLLFRLSVGCCYTVPFSLSLFSFHLFYFHFILYTFLFPFLISLLPLICTYSADSKKKEKKTAANEAKLYSMCCVVYSVVCILNKFEYRVSCWCFEFYFVHLVVHCVYSYFGVLYLNKSNFMACKFITVDNTTISPWNFGLFTQILNDETNCLLHGNILIQSWVELVLMKRCLVIKIIVLIVHFVSVYVFLPFFLPSSSLVLFFCKKFCRFIALNGWLVRDSSIF